MIRVSFFKPFIKCLINNFTPNTNDVWVCINGPLKGIELPQSQNPLKGADTLKAKVGDD